MTNEDKLREYLKRVTTDLAQIRERLRRMEERQQERTRRQADLDKLRAATDDPSTGEGSLQKLIEQMTWIFGGEFLAGTGRRQLTVLDQLDLALLRPDGRLHCVELKRPAIHALVKKQRNHWIVWHHVHEAVGQAESYLRELDEARDHILSRLHIDCRRASITVVIGHRGHDRSGATGQEIDEAIRTYNSHLSRVSVTTYDDLIENAQRMLDLSAPHQSQTALPRGPRGQLG